MWTVRYTCAHGNEVFEVYCASEMELLALVEVLQSSPRVVEFKVGKFLVMCRDGSFVFQGYNKWVEQFLHERSEDAEDQKANTEKASEGK